MRNDGATLLSEMLKRNSTLVSLNLGCDELKLLQTTRRIKTFLGQGMELEMKEL